MQFLKIFSLHWIEHHILHRIGAVTVQGRTLKIPIQPFDHQISDLISNSDFIYIENHHAHKIYLILPCLSMFCEILPTVKMKH